MKNIVILIFCILLNKLRIFIPLISYILPTDKKHNRMYLINKKIFINNKVNYLPNVIFYKILLKTTSTNRLKK